MVGSVYPASTGRTINANTASVHHPKSELMNIKTDSLSRQDTQPVLAGSCQDDTSLISTVLTNIETIKHLKNSTYKLNMLNELASSTNKIILSSSVDDSESTSSSSYESCGNEIHIRIKESKTEPDENHIWIKRAVNKRCKHRGQLCWIASD